MEYFKIFNNQLEALGTVHKTPLTAIIRNNTERALMASREVFGNYVKIVEDFSFIKAERTSDDLKFKALEPSTISIVLVGTPSNDTKIIQYSINNSILSNYTIGNVISLNAGDTITFISYDNEPMSINPRIYKHFVMTGSFVSEGGISSLINRDDDVTNYGFYKLFYNCTQLKTAPEILFKSIGNYSFSQTFKGCTSLLQVPNLSITNISNNSFKQTFEGCSSLETIPKNYLPLTNLAESCYAEMFMNCTNLQIPSELPAENLPESCYNSMFKGCSSLIRTPNLSAEILGKECYSNMFENCTSLTEAYLPARDYVEDCYWLMFKGCTNFNQLICELTTLPDYDLEWLVNVALAGEFVKNDEAVYNDSDVHCPIGWRVSMESEAYIGMYFQNMSLDTPGTFSIKFVDTANHRGQSIKGGYDKNNLTTITNTTIITLEPGLKYYFGKRILDTTYLTSIYSRLADNTSDCNKTYYITLGQDWTGEKDKLYCFGGVCAIEEAKGSETLALTPSNYAYLKLFAKSNIYRAPLIRAITINKYTCYFMFTESNIYDSSIFNHVTRVGEGGMYGIFSYTYNLKHSLQKFPVTYIEKNGTRAFYWHSTCDKIEFIFSNITYIGATGFVSFFAGMYNLVSIPKNIFTNITCPSGSYGFDSIFHSCINLENLPDLPNCSTVNEYGFGHFFMNCSSAKVAPTIPQFNITGLNHVGGMFLECTNLKEIHWNNTIITNMSNSTKSYRNSSYGWLSGVAPTGTLYVKSGVTVPMNSEFGCPSGWTLVRT